MTDIRHRDVSDRQRQREPQLELENFTPAVTSDCTEISFSKATAVKKNIYIYTKGIRETDGIRQTEGLIKNRH